MTEAEIIAELFSWPCDYGDLATVIAEDDWCEKNCSTDSNCAAKCWQRYFELRKKQEDETE